MRFLTAGESHGPAEIAIVEGMPAGVPLLRERIDAFLARRQAGYGRGGRMQIETDRVRILSGVRQGKTTGAPIALMVPNKDWENWRDAMSPEPPSKERLEAIRAKKITRLRPGHADFPGVKKYALEDARDILERASARETVARVLVGAVAQALLDAFSLFVHSHVLAIGGVWADRNLPVYRNFEQLIEASEASPVRCADKDASERMKARIDRAKEAGDSLGGVIEIVTGPLPVGLGSHVQGDRRLDARLSGALMSIPAVKGVEFGDGFHLAELPGSEAHDPFLPGFARSSNHAGGIEGGMTNGQPLIIRIAMKPIPTMTKPLPSIDLSGEVSVAHVERSDVCAVPACGVVAEAMVAWELAVALQEKWGGDSLKEMQR